MARTELIETAPAQEITIDVVVRDKKGRLYRQLEAPDIEIKDDGSPVAIRDLRLLGPKERSATDRAQTIALVFDSLISESRRARKAAEDIVGQVGPGTWFAVFYAGQQFAVVQPYTQDRAAVRSAIEKATFQPKRRSPRRGAAQTGTPSEQPLKYELPPEGSQAGELARISFDSAAEAGKLATDESTRSPVAGLLAFAQSHTRFQGRKAVVLFSESLQLTTRLQALLRETIATANRANLSIFMFDTTELSLAARRSASIFGSSMSLGTNFNAAAGSERGGRMDAAQQAIIDRLPYAQLNPGITGQAPMRELTNGTGGFYRADLQDSGKAVRRLIESLETHYEARFVAAATEFDGRYRPLTVTVKNPGLRVQSQTGYVALPPGASQHTRPFEFPLLNALGAEPLRTDVGFRSGLLHMGRSLAVVVEIPIRNLSGLDDASSRIFSVNFSVLARIRGSAGDTVESFSQEVPYRIALERREEALSAVFTFYRTFSLRPGGYTLECAVFDQNSKRSGAGRSVFSVDPVPEGPVISDIALVRDVEPRTAEGAEDRFQLGYKNSKVVPQLGSSFAASSGVPFQFFLTVEPVAGRSADVEVGLSREGVTIAESSFHLPDELKAQPVPLLFSVPTANLSSGGYEVRVKATQGSQTRATTATFRVEGPQAQTGGLNPPVVQLKPLSAAEREPGPQELERILEGMRKRALEYTERLPNFGCLVATRRWVDPSGLERWRPKDRYVELVRVVDNQEEHTVIEVDGRRPEVDPKGLRSSGEFGALLKMALDPTHEPEVRWKEWSLLHNKLVHVFSYHVDREHSTLRLLGNVFGAGSGQPGYHGLLYVEPDTLNVRRLTLAADVPPAKSSTEQVSIAVDYDYIALGQRDHVLPVQGEIRVRTRRGALNMNQLEFRDYRRFSAQSDIRFEEP